MEGDIMGSGGVPNRRIETSYERNLPRTGKPNSRTDRYKNGMKVQSRWYDQNGRAERNRDYSHQGAHNNHSFPHDHKWDWNEKNGKRDPTPLPPDYINYN